MTRSRPALATALLWGSVWGLGEATLGHLLHLVRVPGLPGLVMAPLAVLIMGRVVARSRSAAAVFLAGVVAASFKLFDLIVPGTDLLALSRPIQAILLEALAGAVWVGTFDRERGTVPIRKRGTVPMRGQSLSRKEGHPPYGDSP